MTTQQLLQRIEADFERLGTHPGAKERFMPYVQALAIKDVPTLEHSAGVAYKSEDIARYTHIASPKTLWLPGLAHDFGKLLVPPEVLKKKEGFNDSDRRIMSRHVEDGCRMLLGIADFSALVLFYHHYFKTKGAYPVERDYEKIFGNRFDSWSEGTRTLAKYCGRLISVADFWHAATTRENDRNSPGKPRLPTSDEAKKILIDENRDQQFLIEQLYNEGIF